MKKLDINNCLLNIESMDKHHRDFIDMYNKIDFDNDEMLICEIHSIINQTKIHFLEEEELMKKYSYPRILEHKEEHDKIIYELTYFIKKASEPFGKKLLKSFCKERLVQWFENHIVSMDSDLAYSLKNRQVN